MKRPVRLHRIGNAWVLDYLDRKKYGRYLYAQFYCRDHSLEFVIAWCKKQRDIELKEVSADL